MPEAVATPVGSDWSAMEMDERRENGSGQRGEKSAPPEPGAKEPPRISGSPAPAYPPAAGVWCGGYGGWYAPPPPWPQPAERGPSSKPRVAGLLLILSGALSLLFAALMGAMLLNIGPIAEMAERSEGDIGELRGVVILENSTPAEGARVTLTDIDRYAVTNESGSYRILNLPVGWHDVEVEMDGYMVVQGSVYVEPLKRFGATIADFQLQPGSGVLQPSGESHTPGERESELERNALPLIRSMGAVCVAAGLIGGVLAILGGWCALQRANLPIVLAGAVGGILSFGFGLGAVLSVIALILLILSVDEFERAGGSKGR